MSLDREPHEQNSPPHVLPGWENNPGLSERPSPGLGSQHGTQRAPPRLDPSLCRPKSSTKNCRLETPGLDPNLLQLQELLQTGDPWSGPQFLSVQGLQSGQTEDPVLTKTQDSYTLLSGF